jgi:hypothetical protein
MNTMEKQKLICFSPICEWNDFVTFNCYLNEIKSNFDDLIVVVSEKALSIITAADSYITIESNKLDRNSNYPNNLEIKGHCQIKIIDDIVVNTHVRNNTNFFELAYEYIKNNNEFSNYKIVFYENEFNLYGKDAVSTYTYLFNGLNDILKKGELIYPTEDTFKKIEKKYINLFNPYKKTYLIITRNFNNKANEENTINLLPDIEDTIYNLTKNGIRIINIGFPAQKLNISNENYYELNEESLTQEELISFMYLTDGVLLSGRSGGFAAHIQSNADIFLIYPEWSLINKDINIEVFPARMQIPQVYSNDISSLFLTNNFNEIYSVLSSHIKVSKRIFSTYKKIRFI